MKSRHVEFNAKQLLHSKQSLCYKLYHAYLIEPIAQALNESGIAPCHMAAPFTAGAPHKCFT